MFTRLVAMFLAVILLLTAALTIWSFVALREKQISDRLDALTRDAREIAYLAAQNTDTPLSAWFGVGGSSSAHLAWKAQQVNQTYGAYIMVVDRAGRTMSNLRTAYEDDPSFAASLNQEEIVSAMVKILGGQEMTVRGMVNGAPTFTLGVPFVQNGAVLGAVFIQTAAQAIEGIPPQLLWQVVLTALVALVLASLGGLLFVHYAVKPITRLTAAARQMSSGDFSVRVERHGGSKEMRQLGDAFNSMAEKLEVIERGRREFVANVSHELRSPITSIRGYAEGMADGTIPQEEYPAAISVVVEETRRLGRLIGDLLALSRLEREDVTLDIAPFDIHELLRRALVRRMNDLDEKAMDVRIGFDEEPLMVKGDRDRLEQVVTNLLDNAIKFTPREGWLSLTTSSERGVVTVTVANSGPGIDPADRPRVFERFFTGDKAHTSGTGTGLGLSICQRIMEMHHQTIRLIPGEGETAFAFTLEQAERQKPQEQTRTKEGPHGDGSQPAQ